MRAPEKSADLVAYIDGGARGNPGPAGAGVYLEIDGIPWRGLYRYLERQTNNYAEYTSLIVALEYALEHGFRGIAVLSDSELLVKQVRGEYKVKNPNLQVLHAAAARLISGFQKFSIRHIPRQQNRRADALANKAQDLRVDGEVALET